MFRLHCKRSAIQIDVDSVYIHLLRDTQIKDLRSPVVKSTANARQKRNWESGWKNKQTQRGTDMSTIHVLGRMVIISKDHVLLAHEIGEKHTFLPGGHVEYNEGVKNAILRELKEEFNGEGKIDKFIGVIEYSFDYKGEPYHELKLLFSGRLSNYNYPQIPKSLEPNLEFYWYPIKKLKEVNLLPPPTVIIISDYYKKGKTGVYVNAVNE